MLFVVKFVGFILILGATTFLGVLISKKYSLRVNELQELITGLEIFETRLNYTYDTIPDAFDFIHRHLKSDVRNIFKNVSNDLNKSNEVSAGDTFMKVVDSAGDTFMKVVDEEKSFLALTDEDVEALKGLSVSLGQTDLENQSKNIKLIIHTLSMQLESAKFEKNKNFKLFRNMGVLVGLMLIIILI